MAGAQAEPVHRGSPFLCALLSAALFFSFLTVEAESFAAASQKQPQQADLPPAFRIVMGGLAGASLMSEKEGTGVSWSHAVGVGLEMSLADEGLTPILQAGYLVQNDHWFHSIPVDFGGRYLWIRNKIGAYVSGGISILIIDEKVKAGEGGDADDWEVDPLVYVDLGARAMLARRLGIEVRLEYRTYVVVNVIGLRIGLAM